jgi:glycosyltransferase involved in cell wall biosynthesis
MRARLTVLIPCRDERLNIRPCIESVRGLADEILVADSGSRDGTPEIARSLGARVIEREFGGYADFKNWAIPQAAHAWVLILDADERVTEPLAGEIRGVLADPPAHLDGYWVLRRTFFMGREIRHCGWNTDDVFRLIRRDVCRYRDTRVHEEIDLDPARAGRLKNRLLHYTYWSYDRYFDKYLSYTKLGAEDRWERGKRASWHGLLLRPFARFFQLYVLRLGFLDGLAGIQVCMLQSFFVTFVKQARLWEMEHALPQPDPEAEALGGVAESAGGAAASPEPTSSSGRLAVPSQRAPS